MRLLDQWNAVISITFPAHAWNSPRWVHVWQCQHGPLRKLYLWDNHQPGFGIYVPSLQSAVWLAWVVDKPSEISKGRGIDVQVIARADSCEIPRCWAVALVFSSQVFPLADVFANIFDNFRSWRDIRVDSEAVPKDCVRDNSSFGVRASGNRLVLASFHGAAPVGGALGVCHNIVTLTHRNTWGFTGAAPARSVVDTAFEASSSRRSCKSWYSSQPRLAFVDMYVVQIVLLGFQVFWRGSEDAFESFGGGVPCANVLDIMVS